MKYGPHGLIALAVASLIAIALLPSASATLRTGAGWLACGLVGLWGGWGLACVYQRRGVPDSTSRLIETIAERAHDGIVIAYRERLVFCNHQFADMLGYARDEVQGKALAAVIAPEERALVVERYRRRTRGEPEPAHYESALLHRNGRSIPVDLRVGEIEYQGQLSTMAITRDLTERRRTQAALQASEARSEAILYALPDLMYRIDRDGRYLDIRAHGQHKLPLRTLDVPPESLTGRRLAEVLPQAQAELIAAAVRRALDSNTMQIIEYDLPTLTGTRAFEARIVVSGPDEVVSIVRDVSERKRIERERERLIKDLDAFSQTVAHDLKTPLTSIMGYAEMLTDDFNTLSSQDRHDFLWIITHESRKMDRIIHELLLFASVREQRDVPRRALNMEFIVTSALGRMSYMITERNAEITTPASWPIARGYAPWVEEVWVNYLSNALKYGGTPPLIELGATVPDESRGKAQDGAIRFWIRDNGPGIAQEDYERVFDQFTRLNELNITGYGLGLSIVKRIIEKLGGTVGVDSTPGQGSTFYFTLPKG